MKLRHHLSTALLVAGSFLTINLVTAQADAPQNSDSASESPRTQAEILAGLETYARNMEEAYDALKAEKEAMERAYETLQDEKEAMERAYAERQRAYDEQQAIIGNN